MATITELWRFPVKSMQGERVDAVDITARGIAGDRAFAVVDADDGLVASAKQPRKWAELLQFSARLRGDAVEITTPDGAVLSSDDDDIDARLTSALGRDVRLGRAAEPGSHYEMVFPHIDGLAPDEFIAATRIGDEDEGTLTRQTVGAASPAGTFFDVSTLHLVTTATLTAAAVDVRRLRPNIVIDAGGDGYLENDWAGRSLALGAEARADVLMPTMRCVMTTLPQPGLERDRAFLQRLTSDNRIAITGMGRWACAGVYASVTRHGPIAVGDGLALS